MPAVQPGSLVLVTGGSGFIAAHACDEFLKAGFPVRTTVRSTAKGDYLASLFKGSKVPFEYVIVEDIEQGAFDEAVKDVVGVAHMASPFHTKAKTPSELIGPAVQGTVGVLKSIKKNNPNVQRVVITSSVAAIGDNRIKPPHHYTEKDWNTYSAAMCEEKGDETPGGEMYRASKTLAEEAFWKFIEEEKPSFDGATINPPMVYGPVIHPVDKPESLNTSVAAFYDWLKGGKTDGDIPDVAPFNAVDVRDVPEPAGERFIISSGPASPNDYCLVLHKHFPQLKGIPDGDASKVDKINAGSNFFDGSKATRILGLKYHTLEETLKDMASSLIEKFNLLSEAYLGAGHDACEQA